ncbi:hypothetical protein VSS74_03520 [Conexibacter stalactiti]|uniref:Uncharacterized protein n=1 Tax=Conexibacter stalactiti TaxID=1940611 RepID=A0ABU4HJ96_9ACTN|nr:hypothetical protein [Conexibacter stalactiti]MDW5593391.1 hypothetical protein [Conexibacter stalactiti]MEC5034032.1 hypothetical protein [Conexibacter stalactiti]
MASGCRIRLVGRDRCREEDREFVIVRGCPPVQRVFGLTRFEQLLPFEV